MSKYKSPDMRWFRVTTTIEMHFLDPTDVVEEVRGLLVSAFDDYPKLESIDELICEDGKVLDTVPFWRKDAQLNDKPALDAEYLQAMQEPTYFDPSRKEVSSDAEVPTDRDSDA